MCWGFSVSSVECFPLSVCIDPVGHIQRQARIFFSSDSFSQPTSIFLFYHSASLPLHNNYLHAASGKSWRSKRICGGSCFCEPKNESLDEKGFGQIISSPGCITSNHATITNECRAWAFCIPSHLIRDFIRTIRREKQGNEASCAIHQSCFWFWCGLTAAMEEQKAQGADLDDESFTSIKTGDGTSGRHWWSVAGVAIPLLIVFFWEWRLKEV